MQTLDLIARLAQHPCAQLDDESTFVGQWNEFIRTDNAQFRMSPAHQRLATGDSITLQFNDGLKLEKEFIALDRVAQGGLQNNLPGT